MTYNIDFSIATSNQIEIVICHRLEEIRLTMNITQSRLAEEAGVSLKTISRLEKGQGVSFDTFIRVLIAFGIQSNLESLLPDPKIRPIERIKASGVERKRARTHKRINKNEPWSWGN